MSRRKWHGLIIAQTELYKDNCKSNLARSFLPITLPINRTTQYIMEPNKNEIIEEFLKKLGTSSKGKFYLVCGVCGASDILDQDGGENIEQEIDGAYSEYTGHLWDTVNIKCKKCGNAISFTK